MNKPVSPQHVCIHGHFYQPPRENPWLDEIEQEESARPHHDWNQRISAECYSANAASPVLDHEGFTTSVVNNYRRMSFNVGPTLLRWLERHEPATYDAMLLADQASVVEHRGHGNAIAQVYNHAILPLCNARDKETQVIWGIKDFEMRFGRKPEGMWLAETACDKETLTVLAAHGIRFTILSPHQAKSWRFLDGGNWQDAGGGSIPTGRAYMYQRHNGRPIHLFFYDGEIAKAIAFENMLGDAQNIVNAVHQAHARSQGRPGEPWLVHTATDGESYGHHFKFGNMALAATFHRLAHDDSIAVTNYGAFLSQAPVVAEADILDVSAWSCAHGVGRWQAHCGCAIASHLQHSQAWRGPLREGLNVVRDALAEAFADRMAVLVDAPWDVRNAYIEVVVDRSRASAFAARHLHHDSEGNRVQLFRLLEMQRACLLMFTSCGWFFDDVGGPESVILMKYAARALDLAHAAGIDARAIEAAMLDHFDQAHSNTPHAAGDLRTGKHIYLSEAKCAQVSAERITASLAMRAYVDEGRPPTQLYAWRVERHTVLPFAAGAISGVVGALSCTDERTLERFARHYLVLHSGGLALRCYTDDDVQTPISERANAIIAEIATLPIEAQLATVARQFKRACISFDDVLSEVKSAVARSLVEAQTAPLFAVAEALAQSSAHVLAHAERVDVHVPDAVRAIIDEVGARHVEDMLLDLVGALRDARTTDDFVRIQTRRARLTALLSLRTRTVLARERATIALVAALTVSPRADVAVAMARLKEAVALYQAVVTSGPAATAVLQSVFALMAQSEPSAFVSAVRTNPDVLCAFDAICHSRLAET